MYENLWMSRTEMLLGQEKTEKLKKSKVAVCGLGGVGSYTAEALARSGVGNLLIIDGDTVSYSNINRQLPALNSTIGKNKTDIMKERICDINPHIKIQIKTAFIDQNTDESLFEDCDYIVDAIDDVPAKIRLIKIAESLDISIISAMGCGNKIHPEELEITDIFKTFNCPLCRSVRHRLKAEGIKKLKVVYSKELPFKCGEEAEKSSAPASMIFVPATAGLLLANRVILDLIEK